MCFCYLDTVQVDVAIRISKMLYWEGMSFFYMQNKTADLKKIQKIYFFLLQQKYVTNEYKFSSSMGKLNINV